MKTVGERRLRGSRPGSRRYVPVRVHTWHLAPRPPLRWWRSIVGVQGDGHGS